MNTPPAPLQILALNDAEDSENRIHSDEVARRYGFSSALVSGVNLFGYLTQPLVRQYGEQFLHRGMMDVVFLKPAYQNDLLTLEAKASDKNPAVGVTLPAHTMNRGHFSPSWKRGCLLNFLRSTPSPTANRERS